MKPVFRISDWNERGVSSGELRYLLHFHRVGSLDLPTLVEHSRVRSAGKSNRKLIVNFHGGPESIERGERRFGGLFQEWVDKGNLYLGWNYPGSIGFGAEWQRMPWKNWEACLLHEWRFVGSWIKSRYNIPLEDITLVGASFGALVALLVAKNFHPIRKVVLSSPLLSVPAQMERARRDPVQYDWFRKRFSKIDLESLNFEDRLGSVRARIYLAWSGRDEVLGTTVIQKALAQAEPSQVITLLQKNASHSPKAQKTQRDRIAFLRKAIYS